MNGLFGDEQKPEPAAASGSYLVVARRYRPRTFDELIGQSHVVQGLINAIRSNRVGHAYLFTGARGVGKTSTARIFAKCLNAPNGPTPEPDCDSEICQQIDVGEDIDVIEIDGASNRGIDEIRQLRANVNVRPSRSRYKIYIIDEVHMLTTAAFNALLKTLEEPPAHVKFIFCTTDPDKIPITVRSRCQRFDFAPVAIDRIVERLEQIVAQEQREADAEALRLLAHRAGGSVRDSQSLLEQLLAFVEGRLTVETVHDLLGTANDEKLAELARCLAQGAAGRALAIVDQVAAEGLDFGQLAEQLLQVYRDGLIAEAGGDASLRYLAGTEISAAVDQLRESLGLSGLMAAVQLLDHTLSRLRLSVHARALVELALVRLCHLGALRDLPSLLEGAPVAAPSPAPSPSPSARTTPPEPKNLSAAVAAPSRAGQARVETPEQAPEERSERAVSAAAPSASTPEQVATPAVPALEAQDVWQQALGRVEGMTGQIASHASDVRWSEPGKLLARFESTVHKEHFEAGAARRDLESVLSSVAGHPVQLCVDLAQPSVKAPVSRPSSSRQQRMQTQRSPLVQTAIELFDADVVRVETPRSSRSEGSGRS